MKYRKQITFDDGEVDYDGTAGKFKQKENLFGR